MYEDEFETFEELFDAIINNSVVLYRTVGTNDYQMIIWSIEYFIRKEEYEKCEKLIKLQLPKVDDKELKAEIDWMKRQKNLHSSK